VTVVIAVLVVIRLVIESITLLFFCKKNSAPVLLGWRGERVFVVSFCGD